MKPKAHKKAHKKVRAKVHGHAGKKAAPKIRPAPPSPDDVVVLSYEEREVAGFQIPEG